MTVALPDADPAVAVIVAVPLPTAVTSPALLTVATATELLDQLTSAPAITLPFRSRTSAANCSVAPKAVSWMVAGATATALTSWATVTIALPDAGPAVAVIVARPVADRRHQPRRVHRRYGGGAAGPGHGG